MASVPHLLFWVFLWLLSQWHLWGIFLFLFFCLVAEKICFMVQWIFCSVFISFGRLLLVFGLLLEGFCDCLVACYYSVCFSRKLSLRGKKITRKIHYPSILAVKLEILPWYSISKSNQIIQKHDSSHELWPLCQKISPLSFSLISCSIIFDH